MDDHDILLHAQELIRGEGEAVAQVAEHLGPAFVQAVRLVSQCAGRILVTGAGTSGAMAKRLAHLMATCGMAAFYISPGDALHGESVLASPGDILIAMSKAGKSDDINQFARIARERGCTVMGWTGNPESELASLSHLVIVIPTHEKGEGDGVLPFGNTLAHGALGDALCLLAKRLRGFDLAQLRQTHPLGGAPDLLKKQD
jgi:arabinose-5-phosphate isomerase